MLLFSYYFLRKFWRKNRTFLIDIKEKDEEDKVEEVT